MSSIFDLFNDDFFKGMIDYDLDYVGKSGGQACSFCGMTYSDFNRTGKFGCAHCYESFGDRVPALIKRIQGSVTYEGSVPARGSGIFRIERQIKRLRQALQKAIREENFEDAMQLRDEIKALEKSLQKEK